MKKSCIYALIIAFTFLSCKNDNDSNSLADTFYKDYYQVNISPSIVNFKTEIETQISLIEDLRTTPTLENIKKAQNQWLQSAISFSKVSTYNVVEVKQLFYDANIFNYPVNTSLIETSITNKTTYNTSYFNTQSTVSKGLGTIEYLLFHEQDPAKAFVLLQEDSFRLEFMLGVAKETLRQANLLIAFWEQDYKENFSNAAGLACIENAQCLAFNQLINVLDVIRVTKIGKPAGIENSENTAADLLQAYRSKNSLKLIEASLNEIEYVYAHSSIKFSDIIDQNSKSTEISTQIENAFTQVYRDIDIINGNLYDAILNDNTAVENLYNSLFNLVKLFSVDAASTLRITVLPTDNDGD